MEKEILELLKKMDNRLLNLEEGQKETLIKLKDISKNLDILNQQIGQEFAFINANYLFFIESLLLVNKKGMD